MSQQEVEILQRTLVRERIARKHAEQILELKSEELYLLNQENKKAKERLEALLKVKNSELRGFYENLVDPYIMMDLSGNAIKINEAAEELIGYQLSDGTLNLMELILFEDYDYVSNSFKTLYTKGRISDFVVRLKTKNEEIKLVDVNASIIYDENNEPIAAQGILRDITNLKKLEKQKEELLSELEKSNEGLQEYAHVVSHDLKSPLRSINALVTWLKEDNLEKLDEASLQNIDLIDKTLEKMENLISDVLEYSSVGANLDLNQKVDINNLIAGLIEVMYVPENIEISIDHRLPIILGDQVKLQQVFQNLLSNAIKFSDKEIGQIKISCKNMGTHCQFSVSDNGMGIEKEYFDKIFKIFHSLQKRKDSSGIGLSIVKKIVELHHGDIWLESEKGKGTTFYFTIRKQQ